MSGKPTWRKEHVAERDPGNGPLPNSVRYSGCCKTRFDAVISFQLTGRRILGAALLFVVA